MINSNSASSFTTAALASQSTSSSTARTPVDITLVPAYGDPFSEFPSLRMIWPEPYATAAAEASAADAQSGEVWLIAKNANTVIGITGLFVDDECPDDVFLRWHGLIQSERGTGASAATLRKVIERARFQFPGRKYLVELAPDNEYGWTMVIPHFFSLGFVRDGDPIDHKDAVVRSLRLVFNLENV